MIRNRLNIKLIILLILFYASPLLSNMDTALTVWGAKISVSGFGSKTKDIRRATITALKKFGFYGDGSSETVFVKVSFESPHVWLGVKNLSTGSKLYFNSFKVKSLTTNSLKNLVFRAIGQFFKSLPYKGLIYASRKKHVYINVGKFHGVKKGDVFQVVRFEGDAEKDIKLDEESFPFEETAEIKVVTVKGYSSKCKVISNSGLKLFDKLIKVEEEREEPSFIDTTSSIPPGIKFFAGSTAGQHSVSAESDSASASAENSNQFADSSKKMTLISPVPYVGFELWTKRQFGLFADFQYRKIPLTLQSGTKKKATYMVYNFDIMFAFDGLPNNNVIIPTVGYFSYSNTVDTSLLYYVSTKISGAQIGVAWRKKIKTHLASASLKYYPTLNVVEDKFKRGDSNTSWGFYVDLGYELGFTDIFGVQAKAYYRSIKTKFTGEATLEDIEDKTYTEGHYGLKLLLTVLWSM